MLSGLEKTQGPLPVSLARETEPELSRLRSSSLLTLQGPISVAESLTKRGPNETCVWKTPSAQCACPTAFPPSYLLGRPAFGEQGSDVCLGWCLPGWAPLAILLNEKLLHRYAWQMSLARLRSTWLLPSRTAPLVPAKHSRPPSPPPSSVGMLGPGVQASPPQGPPTVGRGESSGRGSCRVPVPVSKHAPPPMEPPVKHRPRTGVPGRAGCRGPVLLPPPTPATWKYQAEQPPAPSPCPPAREPQASLESAKPPQLTALCLGVRRPSCRYHLTCTTHLLPSLTNFATSSQQCGCPSLTPSPS